MSIIVIIWLHNYPIDFNYMVIFLGGVYMAFFDEIGKKITQTGQGVVQKTKDLADVAKLNSSIADEEGKINNNYYLIGKLYVSMHAADCEEEFKGMILDVQACESKINEYREQLKVIKGIVKCEKCGAEVPNNIAFCSACGNPMPHRDANGVESKIKCESCGSLVNKGMRFCTVCGSPIKSVAVENKVETQPPVQPTVQETLCPNCGSKVENDAAFCIQCGMPIKSATVEAPANVCPNCGTKVERDAAFCTECGTQL